MVLHQRISTIFIAEAERGAFSNRLEQRFLVPDGGLNHDLRAILLLESPHKDEVSPSEVNDRFPLAGCAGQHVREKLNGWIPHWTLPNRSIGELVHENCDAVQRLGIMNVSQFPLQWKAYVGIQDDWLRCQEKKDWLRCMGRIRSGPRASYIGFSNSDLGLRSGYLKEEIHLLRRAIANDLRGRLGRIREERPNVLLVCCGDVARAFYRCAGITFDNTCSFPHPSRPANRRVGRRKGWCSVDAAEKQRLIDALL